MYIYVYIYYINIYIYIYVHTYIYTHIIGDARRASIAVKAKAARALARDDNLNEVTADLQKFLSSPKVCILLFCLFFSYL
jgi:hypothetical protein